MKCQILWLHSEHWLLFAEEQFGVETKTIAVDFGKTDIYPKIEAGLVGLEIGVLGKIKTYWFFCWLTTKNLCLFLCPTTCFPTFSVWFHMVHSFTDIPKQLLIDFATIFSFLRLFWNIVSFKRLCTLEICDGISSLFYVAQPLNSSFALNAVTFIVPASNYGYVWITRTRSVLF